LLRDAEGVANDFVAFSPVVLDEASMEDVIEVWSRVLGSLGNVNAIDTPRNHAKIIQQLSRIYVLLHQVFLKCDSEYLGGWIPHFVPWLFDAVYRGPRFAESRFRAVRLLCQITMTSTAVRPCRPTEHLMRFYEVLIMALRSSDRDLVHVAIRSAWRIISLNLPGSTMITLDVITAVRTILGHGFFRPETSRAHADDLTGARGHFEPEVPRAHAITLVGSLVCLPSAYDRMPLPTLAQLDGIVPEVPLESELTLSWQKGAPQELGSGQTPGEANTPATAPADMPPVSLLPESDRRKSAEAGGSYPVLAPDTSLRRPRAGSYRIPSQAGSPETVRGTHALRSPQASHRNSIGSPLEASRSISASHDHLDTSAGSAGLQGSSRRESARWETPSRAGSSGQILPRTPGSAEGIPSAVLGVVPGLTVRLTETQRSSSNPSVNKADVAAVPVVTPLPKSPLQPPNFSPLRLGPAMSVNEAELEAERSPPVDAASEDAVSPLIKASSHATLDVETLRRELAVGLRAIAIDESTTKTRQVALCSLAIMALTELLHRGAEGFTLKNLDVVMAFVRFSEPAVAVTALELLAGLADHCQALAAHFPELPLKILRVLDRAVCYALPGNAQTGSGPLAGMLPTAMYCLRDWLLAASQVVDVHAFAPVAESCFATLVRVSAGYGDRDTREKAQAEVDYDMAESTDADRPLLDFGCDELAAMCIQPETPQQGRRKLPTKGGRSSETETSTSSEGNEAEPTGHGHVAARRKKQQGVREQRRRLHGGLHGLSVPVVTTPMGSQDDISSTGSASDDRSDAGAAGRPPAEDRLLGQAAVRSAAMKVSMPVAEAVLAQLMRYCQAFPGPAGATRVSSESSEYDVVDKEADVADSILSNPNVQYYALGDATILTLVEVPDGCRLVVRDVVGKMVWDVRLPREFGAAPGSHIVPRRPTLDRSRFTRQLAQAENFSSLRAAAAAAAEFADEDEGQGEGGVVGGAASHATHADGDVASPGQDGGGGAGLVRPTTATPSPGPLLAASPHLTSSGRPRSPLAKGQGFGPGGVAATDVSVERPPRVRHPLLSLEPTCMELPQLELGKKERTPDALSEVLTYLRDTTASAFGHTSEGGSEDEDEGLFAPLDSEGLCFAPADVERGASAVARTWAWQAGELRGAGHTDGEHPLPRRKSFSTLTGLSLHRRASGGLGHNVPGGVANDAGARQATRPFEYARQVLGGLGLVAWGPGHGLRPLQKCDKLLRELKNVDASGATREQHKVAVIYVGPGQRTKPEIVGSAHAGEAFERFVAGLGWPVQLESHDGYTGRVTEKQFPGCSLPYYATATREVCFHVTTMLFPPGVTRVEDPEQDWDAETRELVYKKRWVHVGNDAVHIVWSEDERLFTLSQLPTRFGELTIAIYPMANGLFRIAILQKTQLAFTGPLFDGAVVDGAALPSLVRTTAINADRALRRKIVNEPFFQRRRTYLSETVKRLQVDQSFEQFSANLIAPAALLARGGRRTSLRPGMAASAAEEGGATGARGDAAEGKACALVAAMGRATAGTDKEGSSRNATVSGTVAGIARHAAKAATATARAQQGSPPVAPRRESDGAVTRNGVRSGRPASREAPARLPSLRELRPRAEAAERLLDSHSAEEPPLPARSHRASEDGGETPGAIPRLSRSTTEAMMSPRPAETEVAGVMVGASRRRSSGGQGMAAGFERSGSLPLGLEVLQNDGSAEEDSEDGEDIEV
jgi:hypothetical protein